MDRNSLMKSGGKFTTKYVETAGDAALHRLLVREMIPKLDWRHNGQGMLQAYLLEGLPEARIHIWHDSLRSKNIVDNGLIHDHRFSMNSKVILGCIQHVEYQLIPNEDSIMSVKEVTNARKAKLENNDFHKAPENLSIGRFSLAEKTFYIGPGSGYYFPKFRFHRAMSWSSELTITLVIKTDQEDTKARIIDQGKTPFINAFENTRTDFQDILDLAVESLK